MRPDFLKTSYAASALRIAREKYLGLERNIEAAYRDSGTYRMIRLFRSKAALAFCCSLLGRVSELKDRYPASKILDDSKIAKRAFNSYTQGKISLANCYKDSKIKHLVTNVKGARYLLPVKAAGAILFAAVLVSIALFLLTRSRISAFGWIIRGMLLFAALWAMFSWAGRGELIETSWFIKRIRKENR